MSKPPPPTDTPGPSTVNAQLLQSFATHLATRPAHTRDAYVRDVARLAMAAGDVPMPQLRRAQLSRTLATFHGQGLSGRSLARMLISSNEFLYVE